MGFLLSLAHSLMTTLTDVLPITIVIFGFQLLVIRKSIPHLKKVMFGFFYVLIGLVFFYKGLNKHSFR
jgi:hypothetical protein